MRRRNAVFVTASSDPWHYFHAILVYGCDKVGGEVTVPNDTFTDSVLLGGSAGLAVFGVVSRKRDLPDESTTKASVTRHLFPLNTASIEQASFRADKSPGRWLGLPAL